MPQGTVEVILSEGHGLKDVEVFGRFWSLSIYTFSCVCVWILDNQSRVETGYEQNKQSRVESGYAQKTECGEKQNMENKKEYGEKQSIIKWKEKEKEKEKETPVLKE